MGSPVPLVEEVEKERPWYRKSTGNNPGAGEPGRNADMAKLEFDDEGSRLVEAINTVPDTIERRRAIMRTLNLKTGERVLDVGSGPGHQVLEMSAMVGPSGRVDGVDISESMPGRVKKQTAVHGNGGDWIDCAVPKLADWRVRKKKIQTCRIGKRQS